MYCRIRVQSQLDPSWHHRFAGLHVTGEAAGTSLLSGSLPDQAALQGVLLQIVRLGLALVSLETGQAPDAEETDEKGARAENRKHLATADSLDEPITRPQRETLEHKQNTERSR